MTDKPRLLCGALAALAFAFAGTALAQTSPDKPAGSRPAKTVKPAPRTQVGDSIQHGTDRAGRSISNADASARSGINRGSEAAARPVRNLGDKLGRKLGLGPAPSPPPVGPTSGAP